MGDLFPRGHLSTLPGLPIDNSIITLRRIMFLKIVKLIEKLQQLIVTLEKNRFGALILVVAFGLYVYLEVSSKTIVT